MTYTVWIYDSRIGVHQLRPGMNFREAIEDLASAMALSAVFRHVDFIEGHVCQEDPVKTICRVLVVGRVRPSGVR